jgi:hypothetical protein
MTKAFLSSVSSFFTTQHTDERALFPDLFPLTPSIDPFQFCATKTETDCFNCKKIMTPSILIQYWPLCARASGLFQMLAAGGIDYEH